MKMMRSARGLVVSAGIALGVVVGAAPSASASFAWTMAKDVLVFKDGKQVEGTILEETATSVRMKVEMYGIVSEMSYDKRDILAIRRGEVTDPAPAEPTEPQPKEPATDTPAPVEGGTRVYIANLSGQFGRDISETPIRNAVEDAYRNGAQVIVFVLDSEWKLNPTEEAPDDVAKFDQLFRADTIFPILREEIPRMFDEDPKVVFWVKKAMGGACFLPLVSPNIYFHQDAKMGGVGNLTTMFGSTGDEVVRQKQISLRLATAKGAAIEGGYDTKVIEAMTMIEKVFSYRLEGGKPVIEERLPDPSLGEILLTDDGLDANKDTIEQLARSQGNDVLTLDATLAQKLQISDGTVNTTEELLYALGLSRTGVRVDQNADKIMQQWSDGVTNAERRLRKLWQDFQGIQVQGEYSERTRARGQQRRTLEEMQGILRRYEEALVPQRLGIPDYNSISIMIEQIKLQQLADKK